MTNKQIREWYKEQVDQIPLLNEDWVKKGISPWDRAEKAWKIRHDARLSAREMMEDPIEVELLRNRDMKKYGNREGPTFDYLVEKAIRDGLRGDKICEEIINESSSTNREVDRKFTP